MGLIKLLSFIALLVWYTIKVECHYVTAGESNDPMKERVHSESRDQLLDKAEYKQQLSEQFISHARNENNEQENSDEYSQRDLSDGSTVEKAAQLSNFRNSNGINYNRTMPKLPCGRAAFSPVLSQRIVGGSVARPHSWPWQVVYKETVPCQTGNGICERRCGGTLISSKYVLTAAHCHAHKTPINISIVAGAHNLSNDAEKQQRWQVRRVRRMFIHPGYNNNNNGLKNDISVLELDTDVTFNNYVQPACLPGPDPRPDSELVLVGWGRTQTEGQGSPVLKQAKVQLRNTCSKEWPITDDALQICVIDASLKAAACLGDSGGPALQNVYGRWVVQGITSFGHKICEVYKHRKPDVYVRVSAYLPWINSIINN